ncbi:MAG: hypothetical protein Q7T01_02850, partial [bacterium]|nr:hypothetical protein [bacterium]
MGQGTVVTTGAEKLTGKQELRLYRRLGELEQAVKDGPLSFGQFMEGTGTMLRDAGKIVIVKRPSTPKRRDLARERQEAMREFYGRKCSGEYEIPKPHVSNREITGRERVDQQLLWRPPVESTALISMLCGNVHWHALEFSALLCIDWHQITVGYWYWADAAAQCPRCNCSNSRPTKTG